MHRECKAIAVGFPGILGVRVCCLHCCKRNKKPVYFWFAEMWTHRVCIGLPASGRQVPELAKAVICYVSQVIHKVSLFHLERWGRREREKEGLRMGWRPREARKGCCGSQEKQSPVTQGLVQGSKSEVV